MNANSICHPRLGKTSHWKEPFIHVSEDGIPLRFSLFDAFNYHGFDAPGGVVLAFRLLQRAFALLAPGEECPDRRSLSLFTSFPGLGLKDTVELVTRMVTDSRYRVDPEHVDLRAQEGVAGRFYYRFSYRGKSVELAPVEGYPNPSFISLGRASKHPGFTAESALAWTEAKFSLAETLLGADAGMVIREL